LEPGEIVELIRAGESERLELKSSLDAASDREDIREAACAFANDFPRTRKSGLVVVGVRNNLSPSETPITEGLLKQLEEVRTDPSLNPPVVCRVYTSEYERATIGILEVDPSRFPPIRFRGRTCIRVGQKRWYASFEEEARLAESIPVANLPFDMSPVSSTSLSDLAVDAIVEDYIPEVVSLEAARGDQRRIEDRLASLRLYDAEAREATVAGILLFNDNPTRWVPGALVEYGRFEGHRMGTRPVAQFHFRGSLLKQLDDLESFVKGPVDGNVSPTGDPGPDFATQYPEAALRELVVNAILHRAYNGTNAPTRVSHFDDRIEILNPGGLFGRMSPANLDKANDYRNPTLASVLQAFRYVERFGTGISRVATSLTANGNPPAEYDALDRSYFRVTVRRRPA
jgi:ATP-dependent DNA helicase RecG